MAGYVSDYQELMGLWSPNNTLDPFVQTAGSAKKVLWVCPLGHEWSARILNIKHGSRCPYCSGRKVLPGFNNLQTTDPDVAKLFDKERNAVDLMFVSIGSNKKYWFKCENAPHSYEAEPYRIKDGRRCSYCAGKKILTGFNDLLTTAPNLETWWDFEKNTINIQEVSKGSHKVVWWVCQEGHSFQKDVNEMNRNTVCGYCAGKVILSGYNDLATLRPDFLEFIDHKKNSHVDFTVISPWTDVVLVGKCALGHEWTTSPDRLSSGYRCPYCSGRKLLQGYNDLAARHPELVPYWSDKNDVLPHEISYMNGRKVWWKCDLGHEWQAVVNDIAGKKSWCSICGNHTILIGFNDLLTYAPDIMKYWSDRNEKSPQEYAKGTSKTAHFLCIETGEEYTKRVFDFMRIYPQCPCPSCLGDFGRSTGEKSVHNFVKSLGYKTIANDRTIIRPLELDIVIPELNIAIEFNGMYWHSEEVIQQSRGMSSYDFHKNKFDLAADAGYHLLFVWEDDWRFMQESLKQSLKSVLGTGSTVPLFSKFMNEKNKQIKTPQSI